MKKLNLLAVALVTLFCALAPARILLTKDNSITFRGEVNDSSVSKAQMELFLLDLKRGDSGYPIYLVLDTPGGSIFAGQVLIDYLKTLKNVHTITLFAASMGTAIVQGNPGERLVTASGVHMYHRAAGGFEGSFETGEIESRLEFWKSLVRAMETVNATRLSMNLMDYKAKAIIEWWLYGADIVKAGSADKVVDVACDPDLTSTVDVEHVQVFIFSFDVAYSRCPLFRFPLATSKADSEVSSKYRAEMKSRYPFYNL